MSGSGGQQLGSGGFALSETATNLAEFLESFTEFCQDVHDETKCRRCEKNVPMFAWTYVRLESLVSTILQPTEVAEVGIQFVCKCGAIHIGEPLPPKSREGGLWSSEDKVVEVVGRKCPAKEKGPDAKTQLGKRDRAGRGGDGKAHASLVPLTRRKSAVSGNTGEGEDGADKGVLLETPTRAPQRAGSPVWGVSSDIASSGGGSTRSGGSHTRYVFHSCSGGEAGGTAC